MPSFNSVTQSVHINSWEITSKCHLTQGTFFINLYIYLSLHISFYLSLSIYLSIYSLLLASLSLTLRTNQFKEISIWSLVYFDSLWIMMFGRAPHNLMAAAYQSRLAAAAQQQQQDKAAAKLSPNQQSGSKLSPNQQSSSKLSSNQQSGSKLSPNQQAGPKLSSNQQAGSKLSSNLQAAGAKLSTNQHAGDKLSSNQGKAGSSYHRPSSQQQSIRISEHQAQCIYLFNKDLTMIIDFYTFFRVFDKTFRSWKNLEIKRFFWILGYQNITFITF